MKFKIILLLFLTGFHTINFAQYFPPVFPPSTINGSNGFAIPSLIPNTNDGFGTEVRFIGDINNDGLEDMAIASGEATVDTNKYSGKAFVLFGSNVDFPKSFDLTTLNGRNGFVVQGIVYDERRGSTLAGVGDVNGDGIDDFFVGTSDMYSDDMVLYGSTTFDSVYTVNNINGANGFLLNTPGSNQVDRLGDVNGDGINDILIATPHFSGETWVVFGRSDNFPSLVEISYLDGKKGFRTSSFPASRASFLAGGAGDINGDGFNDIMIGSWNGSVKVEEQISYVVFGKSGNFPLLVDLPSLDGTDGFMIDNRGNDFLTFVGTIGDINHDGIDDCFSENNIILGSKSPFPAKMMRTDFNGINGFLIEGSTLCSAPAGDMNLDGIDDFVISSSQSAYVVYGNKAGFGDTLSLAKIDGSNGFKIENVGNSNIGRPIDGGKDINGDGLTDLLIGAPSKVYVIYGTDEVLGTDAEVMVNQLVVSPNPTSLGQFAITGSVSKNDAYQVAIHTINGMLVFEVEDYKLGDYIDSQVLKAGMYIVKLYNKDVDIAMKLLVE